MKPLIVHGGSIDASQCVNDKDPITLLEFNDDSVTEDTILRVPHESLANRQWCYDKIAFQTWQYKKIKNHEKPTNPMTNQELTADQIDSIASDDDSFQDEEEYLKTVSRMRKDIRKLRLPRFPNQTTEDIRSLVKQKYLHRSMSMEERSFIVDALNEAMQSPQTKLG